MLNKEQAGKKLFLLAAEMQGLQFDRKFINEFRDTLTLPEFETKISPSDWQSHVPAEIKEFWHHHDELARTSFWIIAYRQIPNGG